MSFPSHIPLDFLPEESVSGAVERGRQKMKSDLAEGAIGEMLAHIRERLENATAVAKAAEACAVAGNPEQAVTIVLDVEQRFMRRQRC